MAVRFDAAESYNVTLTLGSQANYTFSCWAYISTDRNTFSTPWSFDANTDGSAFICQTDSDGTTMKVYDDGVGNFVATGPSMSVGTWYYLCVAVAGTSGTFYWRTASSAMSNATWTGAARTITRVLVGDDRYTEWINGRVAAFKFWTAGLTAAEVDNESRQYAPLRVANLQTFYPFVKAETTDYSGNGRTLSGGTGTTTEDGPPIPWRQSPPRLILPAAGGGTTFTADLSGAVTPAGALVRQPGKALSGSIAPSGVPAKSTLRSLAGSTTPSGAVLKLLARALGGSVTPSSALTNVRTRLLAVDGSVAPSGSLINQARKSLGGSATPTGSLLKQPSKNFAGSVTPTGALATIRARIIALAGAVTPTGSLARQAGKSVAGSASPAGGLVRSTARRLLASVTPSGALAATRTKVVALAGALTPTGALTRTAGRVLAGTIAPSATVAKRPAVGLGGAIGPVGGALKLLGRLLGGSTAPSGSVASIIDTSGDTAWPPRGGTPIVSTPYAAGAPTVTVLNTADPPAASTAYLGDPPTVSP